MRLTLERLRRLTLLFRHYERHFSPPSPSQPSSQRRRLPNDRALLFSAESAKPASAFILTISISRLNALLKIKLAAGLRQRRQQLIYSLNLIRNCLPTAREKEMLLVNACKLHLISTDCNKCPFIKKEIRYIIHVRSLSNCVAVSRRNLIICRLAGTALRQIISAESAAIRNFLDCRYLKCFSLVPLFGIGLARCNASAKPIHRGRNVSRYVCDITGADGKLVAQVTSTIMTLRGEAAQGR